LCQTVTKNHHSPVEIAGGVTSDCKRRLSKPAITAMHSYRHRSRRMRPGPIFENFDDITANYPFFILDPPSHNESIASNTRQPQAFEAFDDS
jgi:hypothetical protein